MPRIPDRYSGEMLPGWITPPVTDHRRDPADQTVGASADWTSAFLRIFAATLEKGEAIADLGCLHGAYTIALASAGYRVAGYDARNENLQAAHKAALAAGFGEIPFGQIDARDIEDTGFYWDGVLCSGLLYHLDKPAAFLRTLAKITLKVLVIQTHYSVRDYLVENEGYLGHWYREDVGHPFSAWGNEQSFWLTRPHLLAAIEDAGFPLVFEAHSHLHDINGGRDRGLFVGIKDPL